MKSYSATANIKAAPETIWAILTDAPNYPAWEPWADKIEGVIAPGEKVTAYSKLSPGRGFAATVKEFVPNRQMTWEGGMPLGLLRGVRTFTLEPRGDGSTDFTLREEFSGPMMRLVGGSIPDMSKAFEDFVAGLKARAEGSAPPS